MPITENKKGNGLNQEKEVQRSVLPIPDRPYLGVRPFNATDPAAKFPPIVPLRPPKGAPNVLIVLIDDAGFGASATFGGPIHTPTLDRLAKGGLWLLSRFASIWPRRWVDKRHLGTAAGIKRQER